MFGGVAKPGDFLWSEWAGLFGRAPDVQKAARKTLAACDEASRTDHHVVLNDNIIENNRPHADQDIIANRAAVQNRGMAYRDIVANRERVASWEVGALVRDMTHHKVLNIAPTANPD